MGKQKRRKNKRHHQAGQTGAPRQNSGGKTGKWSESRVTQLLPNVPVVDFQYVRRDRPSYMRIKDTWQNYRGEYVKQLLDLNEDALRKAGFDDKAFENMRKGWVPDGYSFHHIKPKDDGGDNSWENLVLIKRSPEHDAIHAFLDPQIKGLKPGQARTVRFLDVEAGIYPPVPGLKLPDHVPKGAEATATGGAPLPKERWPHRSKPQQWATQH